MTPQEIEQLAREAGFNASIGRTENGKYRADVNALGNDVPIEWVQRFAALVLEMAAKVCDAQMEIQPTEQRQVVAACCASSIRNMAKGLG